MIARPRLLTRALATLLPLLLAACGTLPVDQGPVRTPSNVRGPAAWPGEIRRVAVLPAHDASGRLPPEFTATYDAPWQRALAASQRAEFIVLSRDTLRDWYGEESYDSSSALPPGLLERAAAATGAQAVLFLDLTEVTPYPPLALGFRARLVLPTRGATLWMADEIFDARDPGTARAARIDARARASGPGEPTTAVFQSPSRLADHAFGAVAALLPRQFIPPQVENALTPR
jgi:hypothetical protein